MKIKQEKFFHQIVTKDIFDSVVILDIDGTVTCSSQTEICPEVVAVIRKLQERNAVYIFSNNYNGKRSRIIAKKLQLPYIEAPHKKPNKKILNYIDTGTCTVVAIGDKYLTDGLFAQFAKTKHIRVKRYRCKEDSLFDKASCLFDDCVYKLAKLFRCVR
ncbi:MAG: hypothetical protein CR972_04440 [Candidatus Moraniibacteriota bacterium]|nr:MAG: hypothetical protein CR972_04440 [Candidatus Moranbacteria bacterium]